MLRLATLGPAGTNHELITHRYMRFLGVDNSTVTLVERFSDAVQALVDGTIDAILQCAVHAATPQTLGENFRQIFAVDVRLRALCRLAGHRRQWRLS